ncbi:hypothetical protein C8J57DRAFT_1512560 [Mycena rebaudengoi]|nr:hypothetical protein C8J57DRAFT_1512560 [Mycena rebaudengoi]
MAGTLDSTYGVAFVTLFLATMQTLRNRAPSDFPLLALVLKRSVGRQDHRLVILETIQIILYFDGLYLHFIDNFNRFAALDIIFWQDSAQLLFGYLSAFIVQMYFGYCICILNPRAKIVSAPVVSLSVISLASAIAEIIRTTQVGYYSLLNSAAPLTLTIQSVSCFACDIVITAALVYTLRGSKGEIKGTNAMLSSLIINAVNRGMLTALCAMINMTLV